MNDHMVNVEGLRRRAWADRPSPAIPLLLLGLVVVGGLVVALIRAAQVHAIASGDAVVITSTGPAPTAFSSSNVSVLTGPMPMRDPVRLWYWAIASIAAYALAIWIARRQGYRRGVWVSRRPLVAAGLVALVVAVVVVLGWFAPGDLLIRGNVPLLAIAVGIIVWAARERRPGLWVVAICTAVLTLLANLYNMENLFFDLGIPYFDSADEVANLGCVAAVLLISAAVFAVQHRSAAGSRGAR